jgi:hypothetical protein
MMHLSPEAQAALDRYVTTRKRLEAVSETGDPPSRLLAMMTQLSSKELNQFGDDNLYLMQVLTDSLFPTRVFGDVTIKWSDPITPQALLASGWKCESSIYTTKDFYWFETSRKLYYGETLCFPAPANMGDLWCLLDKSDRRWLSRCTPEETASYVEQGENPEDEAVRQNDAGGRT